jgi:hypothetical protein
LNQTLHVRNGSAGTSCRLSTFLGSIRCCKMSTFTLSRYEEAVVVSLVCHETSKVARRVSCGRPQPWGAGRFSAHRASAPLCALDPEMGSAPVLITDSEAAPDRSPSLEPIAGDVWGYLKTQGGVSKSQGQCEA